MTIKPQGASAFAFPLAPDDVAKHPKPAHMATVVTISGVDVSGVDIRKIQPRDAKAGLSAVVDEAMRGEPALITRHGKPQAVIPGFQEWERRLRIPSFGRLLMAAPVTPDDLPARDPSPLRPADF